MKSIEPDNISLEQLHQQRRELISRLAEIDARIVESEMKAGSRLDAALLPYEDFHRQLRERAEKILSNQEQEYLGREELDEILHKYEVMQIELSLQNEALQGSQEELYTTLNRYYNLFDSSPLGYLVTDMVGKIQESNKAARKLLEVEDSQRQHSIFSTFVAKKSLDLYYTLFNRLHNNTVLQEAELHIITASGKEILTRVKFSVLIDGDQNHRRYLIIIENLNKQHELAMMLERTEQKFEYIYRYAPIGIVLVNNKIEIQQANAFFCEMIKISENDLIGRRVEQITHPDDYDHQMQIINSVIERRSGIARLEKRYIRSDKKVVWVSLTTKMVYNDEGEWKFGLGLVEDITERKEAEAALRASEERFRLLAENSSDAILQLDGVALTATYLSPACERLLGYPVEYFLGKSAVENTNIIFEEDLSGFLGQMNDSIEARQNYATYTYRVVRADKKVIWIESVVRSNFSEEGELLNSIVNMRDITERKRIEDELKRSELELREANAEKDKLFSIIGHDLKNPISSINMITEVLTRLMQSGYDEEKFKGYVESIKTSANNANVLLEDLLNWARFQQGRYEVRKDVIPLKFFIDRVLMQFKTGADEKGVAIYSSGDPELNAIGDSFMLNTILRNLVGNAVKFTSEGDTIELLTGENDGYATISVKDSGVGIPEENKAKLLRIDSMHSTRGTAGEKGTGFGLILCNEFAEQMGTGLSIDSQEGKGSTFSFTLPVTENGCPEKQ